MMRLVLAIFALTFAASPDLAQCAPGFAPPAPRHGFTYSAAAPYDLTKAASAEFGRLTQAEKMLLLASEFGDAAVCAYDRHPSHAAVDSRRQRGVGIPCWVSAEAGEPEARLDYFDKHHNYVDNAGKWSGELTVRANLIRWLSANPEAQKHVDPKGIVVFGVRIDSRLDLSYINVPFPLAFRWSSIPAGLDLISTQLKGLDLEDTHTGRIMGADLNASDGAVFLRHGFESSGALVLEGAKIGVLDFSGGHLTNLASGKQQGIALNLQGAEIGKALIFGGGFESYGKVHAVGLKVHGDLQAADAHFRQPSPKAATTNQPFASGHVNVAIDLPLAEVDGSVLFWPILCDGEVNLDGARIGGDLWLDGNLSNPGKSSLSARRLQIGGSGFLNSSLKFNGLAMLNYAKVGADLTFAGSWTGQRHNANIETIEAAGIDVTGNLTFGPTPEPGEVGPTFKSDGTINLSGAEIGGDLDVDQAEFVGKGRNGLIAEAASIKNRFFWRAKSLPNTTNLALLNATVGSRLIFSEPAWRTLHTLSVDGLSYTSIDLIDNERMPTSADTYLEWLGTADHIGFHTQPYRQLADVLGKNGNESAAKEILIAQEGYERHLDWLRLPHCLQGFLTRLSIAINWLWGLILKLVIGYGYRPFAAVTWALVIVLIGWRLVLRAVDGNILEPVTAEGLAAINCDCQVDLQDLGFTITRVRLSPIENVAKREKDGPSPFLYSLEAFLPLLDLDQLKHWRPKTDGMFTIFNSQIQLASVWLRRYILFEKITGWILSAIFLAAMTGLIKR